MNFKVVFEVFILIGIWCFWCILLFFGLVLEGIEFLRKELFELVKFMKFMNFDVIFVFEILWDWCFGFGICLNWLIFMSFSFLDIFWSLKFIFIVFIFEIMFIFFIMFFFIEIEWGLFCGLGGCFFIWSFGVYFLFMGVMELMLFSRYVRLLRILGLLGFWFLIIGIE